MAFADTGVVSSLLNLKDEKMKKDARGNLHLTPVGSHLAHCFCSPVSKVAFVAFADTGVVSSLINSKDEKMKEDAARELPLGNHGVPFGLLFMWPRVSLRSLVWPSPILVLYLLSLI